MEKEGFETGSSPGEPFFFHVLLMKKKLEGFETFFSFMPYSKKIMFWESLTLVSRWEIDIEMKEIEIEIEIEIEFFRGGSGPIASRVG